MRGYVEGGAWAVYATCWRWWGGGVGRDATCVGGRDGMVRAGHGGLGGATLCVIKVVGPAVGVHGCDRKEACVWATLRCLAASPPSLSSLPQPPPTPTHKYSRTYPHSNTHLPLGLPADHDLLLSRDDLLRYGNHALTFRIVDRVFAQVCPASPLPAPAAAAGQVLWCSLACTCAAQVVLRAL